MDRFKKIYDQGMLEVLEIWVDVETGVNYVFRRSGNAGGLTPLLDKETASGSFHTPFRHQVRKQ